MAPFVCVCGSQIAFIWSVRERFSTAIFENAHRHIDARNNTHTHTARRINSKLVMLDCKIYEPACFINNIHCCWWWWWWSWWRRQRRCGCYCCSHSMAFVSVFAYTENRSMSLVLVCHIINYYILFRSCFCVCLCAWFLLSFFCFRSSKLQWMRTICERLCCSPTRRAFASFRCFFRCFFNRTGAPTKREK